MEGKITGVERSLLQLLEGLCNESENVEINLACPATPSLLLESSAKEKILSKFKLHVFNCSKVWWRERKLPKFCRQEKIDLWHSHIQAIPLRVRCPVVATMHELSWMHCKNTNDEGPIWKRKLYAKVVSKKAKQVLCVSETTMRDLKRHCPHVAATVVHHGVDEKFFIKRVPENKNPFILFVGRPFWRKGLKAAIATFAKYLELNQCGSKLLIAGTVTKETISALELAKELGINNKVKALGYVSEEELMQLYSQAQLLLMPSLSEGFGLPALEGMAAGCPVLANAGGSLPEILGDASSYVDFNDPSLAASAIKDAIRNADYYGEKGRERARKFSTQATAKKLLSLWSHCIK